MWTNIIGQLENVIEKTFDEPDENESAVVPEDVTPPPAEESLGLRGLENFLSLNESRWDDDDEDEPSRPVISTPEKPQTAAGVHTITGERSVSPPSSSPSIPPTTDTVVSPSFFAAPKPDDDEEEEENDVQPDDTHSSDITTNPTPIIHTDTVQAQDDDVTPPAVQHTGQVPEEHGAQAAERSREEAALLKFQQQLGVEMNENDKLRAENGKLKQEVRQLRSYLEGASEKIAQAKELPLLIRKLEMEVERVKELNEEVEKKRKIIDELNEEMQEYSDEITSLKSEIKRHEEGERTGQQRINELEVLTEIKSSQLGSIQSTLNELQHENESLRAQVSQMERNGAGVDTEEYKRACEERTRLEGEVDRLTANMQAAAAEYETRLQRMEGEVFDATCRANEAEARLEDLERNSVYSLQTVRTDVESMQTLLSQTTQMKAALEAQCEQLKKENYKLKTQETDKNKSLVDVIDAQKMEMKEMTLKHTVMAQRVAELEQEKSTCLATLAQKENEIDELRQREWHIPTSLSRTQEHQEGATAAPREVVPARHWEPALYPAIPHSEEKKNSRLESEVVRQAVTIKELRDEIATLKKTLEPYKELQAKHDILLQMFGEAEERIAELQKPRG